MRRGRENAKTRTLMKKAGRGGREGGSSSPEVSIDLSAAPHRSSVDIDRLAKGRMNARQEDLVSTFQTASGFHRNKHLGLYLSEPPPEAEGQDALRRWHLAHFMEHAYTKGFLLTAIVLNAISIGISTDTESVDFDATFAAIELTFLAIYTLELGANLYAFGGLFLADAWNWVDVIIVVSSLIDMFIQYVIVGSSGNEAGPQSAGRLLRCVRVAMRLSRIGKLVKSVEKLLLLVESFIAGLASAVWVVLLLVLGLYLFAIMAVELFSDVDSATLKPTVNMDQLWGSIPRSFVTLMQLFSDDGSVSVIMRPMGEANPACWIFFVLFTFIISMGLLELLGAVFIESLLEEKAQREKSEIRQADRLKDELIDLVKAVFEVFDEGGKGKLNLTEMEAAIEFMDHGGIRKFMAAIEIDERLLSEAAKLADMAGTGFATPEAFSEACVSLTELPRSADVRALHNITQTLNKQHRVEISKVNLKLDLIIQHLGMDAAAVERQVDTLAATEEDSEEGAAADEPTASAPAEAMPA